MENEMIQVIKKTREYLDYIEEHYNNVQEAWKILQDKCKHFSFIYDDWKYSVIEGMVKTHDVSKLDKEEFVQYRLYFFPTDGEKHEASHHGISHKYYFGESFNKACKHHKKENQHHWENWASKKYYNPYEEYLHFVHMIIDWVAMSLKFGDTALEYYEKNKAQMELPEWADESILEILEAVYKK